MPVKRITSRENEQFRTLLDLAEHRQTRRETGRTLLDGAHLLDEALRAGRVPERLILSDSCPDWEAWQARLPGMQIVCLPRSLFNKLSPVASPTGLMAEIVIPHYPPDQPTECAVLLEDIQDPGNLGTLVRTAAAAGVDAVFLSVGCAEAWSPKALRGGQGGHFHVRMHESVDLADWVRRFNGKVLAASLRSLRGLFELDLSGRIAFAFGNEGAGLSQDLLSVCEPFSIPMAARVESLNVTSAAAVCLFERVRQVSRSARAAP